MTEVSSPRSQYELLLLEDLVDIVSEFDSDKEKAYCALCTIAAGGKISESLLSVLFVELPVSRAWLVGTAAKFVGMELIELECSCVGFDKMFCIVDEVMKNSFLIVGENMRQRNDKEFLSTKEEIDLLTKIARS